MLTKNQKEAIEYFDSPLLLLAGPGTGKTHVLCEKIVSLINEKGFSAHSILALTFSEKAASEMSERVSLSLASSFNAFTFHSYAKEILTTYAHFLPELPPSYTLLEESYGQLIVRRLLDQFSLSSQELKNNKDLVARELFSSLMRLKEEGYSVEQVEKLSFDNINVKVDIMTFYSRYEQFKSQQKLLDFSDLLLYLRKLFTSHPQVLEELRSSISYLLVDEFQDLNTLQYELVKFLAPEKNLCVVGDPKQAIYGFRGGSSSFFSSFTKDFPSSKTLALKENFRSSKAVVSLLNSYLPFLSDPSFELLATKEERGVIECCSCLHEDTQKRYLLREILLAKKEGKSIAVLMRRRSELFELSSFFSSQGLDHSLSKEQSFLDDPLLEECFHFFSFLSSPKEASLHLFALLDTFPLRKETLQKLSRTAYKMKCSLFEVLDVKGLASFPEEESLLFALKKNLNELLEFRSSHPRLFELYFELALRFHFYSRAEQRGPDALKALASFERFVKESSLFAVSSLEEFLSYWKVSKEFHFSYEDEEEKSFQLQLLTYHQSKGKEFDVVFLPTLNERRFPSAFRQKLFPLPFDMQRDEFLTEEKRLFFVALSRAKEELHLLYVKQFKGNKLESKPSSFLLELNLSQFREINDELIVQHKSSRQDVKDELVRRISLSLHNEQFSLAKKDIELFELLFKKSKGLQAFLEKKDSDLEYFEKKLKGDAELFPPFDAKNQYYSVSQLQTYKECPRKYMYQQVYKLQGKGKHYFDFGSSVHKVLELLLDEIAEGKTAKELLFAKAFNLLKEHWISSNYETGEQEEQYFSKGVESLRLFIEHELSLREKSTRKTIFKEEKFFMTLAQRNITGVIDRIDELDSGLYEIIDYKTSQSMESPNALKKNLQLYVYAKALEYLKGKLPHELSLWYLIFDEKKSVSFSALEIEEIEKEILYLFEEIEKKNFTAKPSHSCRFCEFALLCPFAKK